MSATLQPQSESDSADSPFSFLRLPLELQLQICASLCRHCQGRQRFSAQATLSELAGSSFKTLKALSETCHALKEIAQPILYHYPDVHTYTPFFKTVIARPELAASVRIFARVYESDWTFSMIVQPRHSKEDFTYLIKLGQKFALNDQDGQEYADHWAEDDASFMRCFRYLDEQDNGDQHGYTTDMAHQSFFSLLTALHFMILPNLEVAMINLYDGMEAFGNPSLNSGELALPYPYLPRVIAAKPEHFSHLDTVIFRNPSHYRQDSLGLERIAFLFPVIPNVRFAIFECLGGREPAEDFHESQTPLYLESVELSWPALPYLEEVYFDPIARQSLPPPLIAISNLVQRCVSLKKLVYRHRRPNEYQPALFSPAELLKAILPLKDKLLHLEIQCSMAKIPFFPRETLFDIRLKEFTSLTTLTLDEELFCHHWLSQSSQDSCLVNILPDSVTSLTVRLHDKFKAIPDIVRLGREACLGRYSELSRVYVHVVDDVERLSDYGNLNEDPEAFDAAYFLHAIDPNKWKEALQILAVETRPKIVKAFEETNVQVEVKFVNDVKHISTYWPMY